MAKKFNLTKEERLALRGEWGKPIEMVDFSLKGNLEEAKGGNEAVKGKPIRVSEQNYQKLNRMRSQQQKLTGELWSFNDAVTELVSRYEKDNGELGKCHVVVGDVTEIKK